jgi:hypothetical protein
MHRREKSVRKLWRRSEFLWWACRKNQISHLTGFLRYLGIGLQEQVPNHLQRLWAKATVVSTEGKGLARTRSGDRQEEDCKETTTEASKAQGRCQNCKTAKLQESRYCGTKLRRNLSTGGAASGVRGGLSLPRRRLSGTWEPETLMLTENRQVEEP